MITPQPHQKQRIFRKLSDKTGINQLACNAELHSLNLLLMLHGFTSSSYCCFESLLQLYSNSREFTIGLSIILK